MKKNLYDKSTLYLTKEKNTELRSYIQKKINDAKDGDIEAISDLENRMMRNLKFGTAGIRAKMGAGFSMLNETTISTIASAIRKYISSFSKKNKKIIIGYDCRINSKEFAEKIARIISSAEIRVLMFKEPMPTPICAFAVLKKKAYAGIVVTASHNPKEYNGIKIYWKNGAQITRVREKKIEAFIRTCSNETPPEEQKDPIEVINEEIAEEYLSKVEKNSLRSLNNNVKLNIAYTALNGLGAKFIKRILQNSSFYDVKFVDKQCIPDGMFSHVKSPNPEDTESLEDLLILAKEIRADVAIANDPDVDRLSVAVPNENFSSYKILTGNEVGSILGSRILEKRKNENQKRLAISTVVSSRILKHIATKNNSSYVDATTGFPNIMNLAEKRNKFFNEKLIFAYEEALGYNIEDFVKDKDGICAAARFVDIVAELRQENKTIINELERIELEYGIFRDLQWSIFFENEHGRKMLTALMNNLRNNHKIGENFAGAIIEEKKDLINEIKGQKTNILIFKLSNEIRLTIRPSGTEPKLKFYTEIINKETKKEKLNEVSLELSEKLRKFKFELLSFLNIKK